MSLSLGIKVDIIEGFTFEKSAHVFKEFAEAMKRERSKNNNNNFIFKLINNSLYGRLGMGVTDIETKIFSKNNFYSKVDIEKVTKMIKINDLIIADIKKPYTEKSVVNSNVLYAAFITAKARIKLYKGFKSVEKNGGRILYCDTDSIFAAFPKGKEALDIQMGDVLFDSKKKDTIIEDAVFIQPKTYGILYPDGTERIVIKGVTNPQISFKELKEKFYLKEKVKFSQTQLRHRESFFFTEKNLIKLIDLGKDKKRIFSDDQYTSKPIKISNINSSIKNIR